MTHAAPGDHDGGSRLLVIAIGNRFRGDDGVGGVVLDTLAEHPQAAALDLLELDGEPTRLIDAWDGRAGVVVVDAVRLDDGTPGNVVELDDREAHDPHTVARWSAGVSSHAAGLGEAVRLGTVLDRLPRRLAVVGVVVGAPAEGPGLSAPVAGAVEVAVAAVLRHV